MALPDPIPTTARYVLSVTPTAQGLQRNPAWRLGTSISVYNSAELDRRLGHVEAARAAGDISDVRVRELTEAERREAARAVADLRRRQRRDHTQARGHSRQR
ncbi:hypothetical protein [Nocardia asiatica]|uniref:hypothetical protein n=1 Tax=Nocardia asiatica TaxID=209252 RepID=UPI0005C1356D|nr:hypothetical protein [Nocardia asiatica]